MISKSLCIAALLAKSFLTSAAHAQSIATFPPPRPVPPSGWTYRWVPPTYQTVTDRQWIPEQTQWVADWVQTSPGHWEQVWRHITTPGHFETSTRRILISEGYWQLVRVDPPISPTSPPPIIARGPFTAGVDGYSSDTGEDLSRFSSLSEWPDKK